MATEAGEMSPDMGGSRGTKRARSPTGNPKITRKRTKTGCLTCRKRRIKCGEEKPVCANCIKSRRHCDGYNPRFMKWIRDPNFQGPHPDFPQDATTPVIPGTSPTHNPFARGPQETGFSPIQPRPSMDGGYVEGQTVGLTGYPTAFASPEFDPSLPAEYFQPDPRFQDTLPPGLQRNRGSASRINTNLPFDPQQPNTSQIDSSSGRRLETPATSTSTNHSGDLPGDPTFIPRSFVPPSTNAFRDPESESLHSAAAAYREPPHPSTISTYPHQPRGDVLLGQPGITQLLEHAAVDIEDNDYYDVFTEEEDEVTMSESLIAKDAPQRSMGVLLQLYQAHSGDLGVRGLDAFMFPGFIDFYRPERVASPLKNEYTAKVFAHFICFTGPMISGAVRLPSISSAVFNKGPIPSTRQSLWTYTLPMMALHNQGLLQAMLAMASLQIAKLQDAAVTPSLKHYSYSLRRVHHAVRHDRKRHEVTTLAATLLLAFYEVMTADHISWSTHLFGASRLIKEINFAKVNKRLQAMKSAKTAQEQTTIMGFDGFFENPRHDYEDSFVDHFQDLDEDLIAILSGRPKKEKTAEAEPESGPDAPEEGPFSNAELQNVQILQDLHWWYCKHDLIHSIVSGNSLMMPYETWGDCPPRSAIGQPNSAHGTLDHVLLLLGRVCHFTVKDRARKIKATFARGNPFRPTTEVPTSSPFPAEGQGQTNSTQIPGMENDPAQAPPPMNCYSHDSQSTAPAVAPQGPLFYGMAPSQGTGTMPSAFGSDQQSAHPTNADIEDIDLESATAAALDEWNQIHEAFTKLSEAFGPWYQPLADNEHPPDFTPFGQTIFYKSYDIASVWAWYYTGLIVLTRAHPSMPPAATVALGIAARQTAQYANTVGRIVAGMTPTCLTNGALHPAIAGAFTETTLPLFFAAVQYTDQAHRSWTIRRLREIENLTGWASVGLCASGCETVWIKAAEMGRGPAYEKQYFEIRNATQQDVRDDQKQDLEGESRQADSDDRRFVPFVKGSHVIWSYNLFDTPEVIEKHGERKASTL